MASADLNDLRATLLGKSDSSGIVEVGEAVEELDAAPLALQAEHGLFQGLRDDAVSIQRHLLDVGLIGGEDGE